jgi:uridine kinase
VAEPIPPTPDLVARLRGVPRRGKTLLIGVDGRGGSGKSTLARELERAAPDVTVIEFDDFYLPVRDRTARVENGDAEVGGDFDWRRLREQVLAPLSNDDPAAYQRYDWPTDELAEWHEVLPGGIVIVEGNYCTRRELFDLYDFTMWVDAPHEVRLARGIDRGGEDTLERWLTQYMPEEERYLAAEDPMRRVDLVLDGGGQ